MTDTTPRSGAPLLAAAQAQKHVTHNEALYQFDAFLCAQFLSRALAAPPTTLNDGDTWLVAASATGDWAGHDGAIAYRADGGWRFYAPFAGLVGYVADESALIVWTGSAWVDYASVLALQNVPLLGVNTTADATNKLAAKSAAVLLDNIGNGVQVKVNKHAAADTASLLYQDNYSGRAEFGLCGDDDFHLKVSADGASWTEALHITTTGKVGMGTSAPLLPFHLDSGVAGNPATSGTTETYGTMRLQGLDNSILDIGELNANGQWWFQGADKSNLGIHYDLLFQPNGGNVILGALTSAGSYPLQVNGQIYATSATIATSDLSLKNVIDNVLTDDLLARISALPAIVYSRKDRPQDGVRAGYGAQHWRAALAGVAGQGIAKQLADGLLALDEGAAHTLKIAALEARVKALEERLAS